jgi:SPP1 family predicted phage head-tail adaptor
MLNTNWNMKNISIGKMDRKITIQHEIVTTNSFNEKKSTWETFAASVWAHVVTRTGTESYQAEQLTAVLTTSFFIRYRTGLDVKMRVVYNNEVYNITSIVEPPEMRREILEIKGELVPEIDL